MLTKAQNEYDHTRVLALQEEVKLLPWNEVWEEYCKSEGCLDERAWFEEVLKYEKEVLDRRR